MAKIDLFISYIDTDRSWAEWIAWQFEGEGYTARLQAWDPRPDTDFLAFMNQAAATADRSLVVLSRHYSRATGLGKRETIDALLLATTAAEGSLVLVTVDLPLPDLVSPIINSPTKVIDLTDLPEWAARAELLLGLRRTGLSKPTKEPQFPVGPFTGPRFPGSRLLRQYERSASRSVESATRSAIRASPRYRSEPIARRPEAEPEPRLPVHVHARMDPELVVGQVASVQVIVSREQIHHVDRPTEASGQASAHPDHSVVVEVIGRVNLTVDGPDRREVPIPASGEPRLLLFDVRATHSGAGELWVVARQGPLPLLTLVLRPQLRNGRSSLESTQQLVAVE